MIQRKTEFDNRGKLMTLWQTMTLHPAMLTAQQKNLEYLLEELKNVQKDITELSWEDSLASWEVRVLPTAPLASCLL